MSLSSVKNSTGVSVSTKTGLPKASEYKIGSRFKNEAGQSFVCCLQSNGKFHYWKKVPLKKASKQESITSQTTTTTTSSAKKKSIKDDHQHHHRSQHHSRSMKGVVHTEKNKSPVIETLSTTSSTTIFSPLFKRIYTPVRSSLFLTSEQSRFLEEVRHFHPRESDGDVSMKK